VLFNYCILILFIFAALTIAREIPRHPEYATPSARINTFTHYPHVLRSRVTLMVNAGFYYTNRGDRVVCYQCGGGLKDWGLADDPWVEHAAYFSRCTFVKIMKGQDFIDRVKQV